MKERALRNKFARYMRSASPRSVHLALRPFAKGLTLDGVDLGQSGGSPDFILVSKRGKLALVEVKLGANLQFGEYAVFQLLAYYVHIVGRDWAELRDRIDQAFWNRAKTTLAQAFAEKFGRTPWRALPALGRRHKRRKYHLFLVVDQRGWGGPKGDELRLAGAWVRRFLGQARVVRGSLSASFVVYKPRERQTFKVINF